MKIIYTILILFLTFFSFKIVFAESGQIISSPKALTKSLYLGIRDEEVYVLQNFLKSFKDFYPEALVTGYFGDFTASAVRRFQSYFSIEPAGIVGPKTRIKINSLLAAAAESQGKGNAQGVPGGGSSVGAERRSDNAQGVPGGGGGAGQSTGGAADGGSPAGGAHVGGVKKEQESSTSPTKNDQAEDEVTSSPELVPETATSTTASIDYAFSTTTPDIVSGIATTTATSTSPSGISSTSTAPKFTVGDRVLALTDLNVRNEASLSTSTILGIQASSSQGVITEGPVVADGFSWWQVNYDVAPDGWSAEEYLRAVSTSTPTPTPSPSSYVLQPEGGIIGSNGEYIASVQLGSVLFGKVRIHNLTCRFCDKVSPETTATVYYTPAYPNDGPQYGEIGPHYYEQTFSVPSIAPWDAYTAFWSGRALLTGTYYFVVIVDPENKIGAYRILRSEFYVTP